MMTCSDESREEVQPGFLLDVENEVPMHAYPAGPSSLRELFQWPSQLLDRMLLHPLGQTLRANLQQAFNHGLLVSPDYSGYGSPEIALKSIASALQAPPEALICLARVGLASPTTEDAHVWGACTLACLW